MMNVRLNKFLASKTVVLLAIIAMVSCTMLAFQPIMQAKPVEARFSLINDYLSGTRYGKEPGPCPNFAEPCIFAWEDVPDWIRRIRVSLFWSTRQLGQTPEESHAWVEDIDEIKIWDLTCIDISLSDARLQEDQFDVNGNQATFSIVVRGTKLSCDAKFTADDVTLITGLPWPLPGTITVSVQESNFNTRTGRQGTGTDLTLPMKFDAQSGESFADKLPEKVDIPPEQCDVTLRMGLDIPNLDVQGIPSIMSGFVGSIATFFVTILEGLIGGIVCQIISGLAYSDRDQTPMVKGVLNNLIDEGNQALTNYAAASTTETAFEDAGSEMEQSSCGFEKCVPDEVSSAVLDRAVDFKENVVLQTVSVAINDWLNAYSDSPQFEPNSVLIINEVVDLLADPSTPGSFKFTEKSLKDIIPVLEVVTSPAVVSIELLELEVSGLNTFKSVALFENSYGEGTDPNDRNSYSLNHNLELEEASASVKIKVTIKDGEWVTESTGDDFTRFSFRFSAGLKDLDVSAVTTSVLTMQELQDKTFGQLVGETEEALLDKVAAAFACGASAIHFFQLPFLRASVGEITDPTLSEFEDDGIKDIVNDVAKVVVGMTRGGLKNQLGDVMNHYIRPNLNEKIEEIINEGTEEDCADPLPPPPPTEEGYIDFGVSPAFEFLELIIEKVLAGEQVTKTSANINALIDVLLQFYAEEFLEEGIVDRIDLGQWSLTPDPKTFEKGSATFSVEEFRVEGLDSITQLQLSGKGANTVDFGMVIGGKEFLVSGGGGGTVAADPLELSFELDVFVSSGIMGNIFDATGAEIKERFKVTLLIEGIDIDLEALIQLRQSGVLELELGQLVVVACILSVVDGIKIDPLSITVERSEVFFVSTDGGFSSPSSAFGDALQTLYDENGQAGGTATIQAMANYIIRSALKQISRVINDFDYSQENVVAGCSERDSPLEGTAFSFIALLPNITSDLQSRLGPQPLPMTPEEADDTVVLVDASRRDEPLLFNWKAHPFGSVINDALTTVAERDEVPQLLEFLADASGDPVSDAFTHEDGDIALTIPLGFFNLRIPLDGIIDGGGIIIEEIGLFGLLGVDFNELAFFKPESKFVQSHRLYFEENKISKFRLKLTLEVPKEFIGQTPEDELVQDTLQIEFGARELKLDVETLIAANLDVLKDITLGHFLEVDSEQQFTITEEAVDCFFGSFFENGLLIPKLLLSVDGFSSSIVDTDEVIISEGVEQLITSSIDIVLALFMNDFEDLSQGLVRTTINDYFLQPAVNEAGECTEPEPPALTGENQILDWEKSNAGDLARWLNSRLRGPDDAYEQLNDIIDGFLGDNVLLDPKFELGPVPIRWKGASFGAITVEFGRVTFENFDSVSEAAILYPFGPQELALNATIEGPATIGFDLSFFVEELFLNGPTRDDLRFTITIREGVLATDMELEVNITRLLSDLEVGNVFNSSEIACVVSTLESLQITRADFSLGVFDIAVECVGRCESPLVEALEIGGKISSEDVLNDVDAPPIFTLAGSFMDLLSDYLVSDDFNEILANRVSNSSDLCEEAKGLVEFIFGIVFADSPADTDVASIMGWTLMAGSILSLGGASLFIPLHRKRKNEIMMKELNENGNRMYGGGGGAAAAVAAAGVSASSITHRKLRPLFFHPRIPVAVKYGVPLISFFNIILLLVAVMAVLALSIDVQFTVAGSVTQIIPIVPLSIPDLINFMWNSGAWYFSLLIAVVACLLPLVKAVLLIAAWFAPTTLLPREKRLLLLEVMDMTGKLGMVLVYIIAIVVSLLDFYVSLQSNSFFDFLPPDLVVVDTIVQPKPGIMLLSVHAVLAMIVNQVATYYHRKARDQDDEEEQKEKGVVVVAEVLRQAGRNRKKILDHVFVASEPRIENGTQFDRRSKYVIVTFALLTVVAFVVAFLVPLLKVFYDGVVGVALELIDREQFSTREFSLSSLAFFMGRGAVSGDPTSQFNVGFFQSLYFITVLLAPMAQISLLTLLWLIPLGIHEQKVGRHISIIIGYWSAPEMMFIAAVACVIAAPELVSWIVNVVTDGSCGAAAGVLETALGRIDGNCLSARLKLQPTAAFIVLALLMQLVLSLILNRATKFAIDDRLAALIRASSRSANGEGRPDDKVLVAQEKNKKALSSLGRLAALLMLDKRPVHSLEIDSRRKQLEEEDRQRAEREMFAPPNIDPATFEPISPGPGSGPGPGAGPGPGSGTRPGPEHPRMQNQSKNGGSYVTSRDTNGNEQPYSVSSSFPPPLLASPSPSSSAISQQRPTRPEDELTMMLGPNAKGRQNQNPTPTPTPAPASSQGQRQQDQRQQDQRQPGQGQPGQRQPGQGQPGQRQQGQGAGKKPSRYSIDV